MNLNTSSRAGAIDLKIVSSGAGTWSILGQLPSPGLVVCIGAEVVNFSSSQRFVLKICSVISFRLLTNW